MSILGAYGLRGTPAGRAQADRPTAAREPAAGPPGVRTESAPTGPAPPDRSYG
ncbi:hypothetical protein [Streptomyces sp. 2132.2]|uniref:hypothetical protein n=1 Tax=Streptomyces sp. 2132.2 TaxID=2485161 RepID=UPI0016218B05|nr:hypothetical protein [Streptomyces sp. 2132.2]